MPGLEPPRVGLRGPGSGRSTPARRGWWWRGALRGPRRRRSRLSPPSLLLLPCGVALLEGELRPTFAGVLHLGQEVGDLVGQHVDGFGEGVDLHRVDAGENPVHLLEGDPDHLSGEGEGDLLASVQATVRPPLARYA